MKIVNYFKRNTIVIFFILCFSCNIIFFVYSLGFFTNLVPTQDPYPEFFRRAQDFNRFLFYGAFFSLLFGLIVMGLRLGKLKRFHFIHYLFILIWTCTNIIVAFITIFQLGIIQELYFALDFNNPEFIRFTPTGYTPSYFIFRFGWVLSVVIIIFSCLLLLNTLLIYLKSKKGGVR